MVMPLVMALPVNASVPVQRVGMPRFDQITAIVETDPDIAWNMFKSGDYDFMPDII